MVSDRLPAAAGSFYRKLDVPLETIGFAGKVREICRPAYGDTSASSRLGIGPAVYFKMLMIGFFENLPIERAIANRCADRFSLRAFLGYDLTENTPEHSSLSVIRSRLGVEVYQGAHHRRRLLQRRGSLRLAERRHPHCGGRPARDAQAQGQAVQ